jgi:hypothetical protein
MNKRFIRSFVFLSLLSITIPAFAGPFGLDMGMTLEQLTAVCGSAPVSVGTNLYKVTPAKPHQAFETYVVQISPTYGVFFIKAIGKRVNTSVYGTELKSAFTQLVTSLENTYGTAKTYDFLRPGSIWDEPNDWMMALRKQERFLAAYWEEKTDGLYQGDILNLGVMVDAISTETGVIFLEYYSKDSVAAEAEAKAVTDSVF